MERNPGIATDGRIRSALRALPSVESLSKRVDAPSHLAVAAARIEIEALRLRIRTGSVTEVDEQALLEVTQASTRRLAMGSLQPLINATGVILHTNLGRAPIAPEAAAAAAVVASSYSNLEYRAETGSRGSRLDHLEPLLIELTGADAAMAVNNNAAAVLLALAALAFGGEVIVGRDQLVEIGGSFRIPDVVAGAGVSLVEVGTTNRTRAGDYEAAIRPTTTALLRVHQSNFRTVGFTEATSLPELADLASRYDLPLIDDLGSGAVSPVGDEPLINESVAAGAVTCFSADKLLGGPQAGVIAGSAEALANCAQHPIARALRLDKLQVAALESTLRLRRDHGSDAIPATAMLEADPSALRARAELMAAAVGPTAVVTDGTARMGGGTLPTHVLHGPVCSIDPKDGSADRIVESLRLGEPAVIARISDAHVILDPRTLDDHEAAVAAAAVRKALV